MTKNILIEIATKDGKKLRKAQAFGKLAIHRERDQRGMSYMQITHTRTGYGVVAVRPKDAVELAQKLSVLDWDFDTPEAVPLETLEGAKPIIEEFRRRAAWRGMSFVDRA
jgi:hypothetical protein